MVTEIWIFNIKPSHLVNMLYTKFECEYVAWRILFGWKIHLYSIDWKLMP